MPRRAAAVSSRGAPTPLVVVLRAGLLGLSLLAGCKELGGGEQDTRPLPAPEPPATSAGAPLPRDEPSSVKRRPADEGDGAKKRPAPSDAPAKPAEPSSEPTAAATPTPASAPDSGGSAPSSPAAAPSALPTPAAPSAACLSRCQGAMQGCLSAPVDGGVPGFGNLELCKKAFEACQAACK